MFQGEPTVLRKFNVLPPVPGTEGDWEEMPWLMGQGVGLVRDVKPAGDIVREMVGEAERTLARFRDGGTSGTLKLKPRPSSLRHSAGVLMPSSRRSGRDRARVATRPLCRAWPVGLNGGKKGYRAPCGRDEGRSLNGGGSAGVNDVRRVAGVRIGGWVRSGGRGASAAHRGGRSPGGIGGCRQSRRRAGGGQGDRTA